MKLRSAAALAVVALLTVPLGAQQQNPAAEYLKRVLKQGETLQMTLAWLRVVGGSARFTVIPRGDHAVISSLAESNSFFSHIFKVHDEIESTIDVNTLSTVRFHKLLQEGKKSKEVTTVIDPAKKIAYRKGEEIKVPIPISDPLAIIYVIRGAELIPGKKYTWTVLADEKVYDVDVNVIGREIVSTEAGSFRTVLVEPKMSKGGIFRDENSRLLVWYTDDERHIPVRVRSVIPAGNITATLRSYQIGGNPSTGVKSK